MSMRKLIIVFLVVLFFGCVQNVKESPDTTIGVFNYGPVVQKWMKDNGKEKATEQEVLGIIGGIKKNMEARGWTVIGVESGDGDTKIWFERPVE